MCLDCIAFGLLRLLFKIYIQFVSAFQDILCSFNLVFSYQIYVHKKIIGSNDNPFIWRKRISCYTDSFFFVKNMYLSKLIQMINDKY